MKKNPVVTVCALVCVICIIIFFLLGLTGAWNTFTFKLRKVDDATNYNAIKKVEDTCRAMIASYTSDKLTWEQYKDDDSPERQSWSDQARMRANKTAANYNEYVMKNSFIWEGNIPSDIYKELRYLK